MVLEKAPPSSRHRPSGNILRKGMLSCTVWVFPSPFACRITASICLRSSRVSLKTKIQDIYDESKQNYGAPKITRKLRQNGEIISERTVGKYMKEMGIRAQWVKPWTITTIDSDFSNELQNILNEQFTPDRPNAVWCSDITYIWTTDGFVYLTSIMDLFSRKIIA